MRGGEKTLAVIAAMFPDAPIHTLAVRRDQLSDDLRRRDFRTSWLQRFVRVPDLQRKSLPFIAAASRSLHAGDADVVICSDAAMIKAIRVKPGALKICYCHSPMRYVWDLYDDYHAAAGPLGRLGLRLFAPRLRKADRAAAETVTLFIANSRCVADRIRRAYERDSVVVHPPVDTASFAKEPRASVRAGHANADTAPCTDQPPPASAHGSSPHGFYLVLGELVPYKRPDLALQACRQLDCELVIIGTGPWLDRLRREAGPRTRVLGWQPDDVVRDHLHRCRALLFCGEEDFGMVPVEAMAAGKPVIAYGAGGALDTVVDGKTGVLFGEQGPEAVADAIRRFESTESSIRSDAVRGHAQKFNIAVFQRHFSEVVARHIWCDGAGVGVNPPR